jgi:nucleoside-diphosphate-sugar epimerase
MNVMKHQRFLVLGGAGMIGSQLAARIASAGRFVAVFDNHELTHFSPLTALESSVLKHRFAKYLKDIPIYRGSICNRADLKAAIRRTAPDCIIHLAGTPIVSMAARKPALARRSILDGTVTLLETLADCPSVKRLVFASSSMVYGDFETDPVGETCSTVPVNLYGALKLSAETLIKGYLHGSGVEPVIVRPSAVYGSGDIHRRVVQTFCENALGQQPLRISKSADMAIDFTHIEDAVEGFWLAATHPEAAGRVFNIARGRARSLLELAQIVSGQVGGCSIVLDAPPAAAPSRPKRGSLDISLARQILGFRPRFDLEAGISRSMSGIREVLAQSQPMSDPALRRQLEARA